MAALVAAGHVMLGLRVSLLRVMIESRVLLETSDSGAALELNIPPELTGQACRPLLVSRPFALLALPCPSSFLISRHPTIPLSIAYRPTPLLLGPSPTLPHGFGNWHLPQRSRIYSSLCTHTEEDSQKSAKGPVMLGDHAD